MTPASHPTNSDVSAGLFGHHQTHVILSFRKAQQHEGSLRRREAVHLQGRGWPLGWTESHSCERTSTNSRLHQLTNFVTA